MFYFWGRRAELKINLGYLDGIWTYSAACINYKTEISNSTGYIGGDFFRRYFGVGVGVNESSLIYFGEDIILIKLTTYFRFREIYAMVSYFSYDRILVLATLNKNELIFRESTQFRVKFLFELFQSSGDPLGKIIDWCIQLLQILRTDRIIILRVFFQCSLLLETKLILRGFIGGDCLILGRVGWLFIWDRIYRNWFYIDWYPLRIRLLRRTLVNI